MLCRTVKTGKTIMKATPLGTLWPATGKHEKIWQKKTGFFFFSPILCGFFYSVAGRRGRNAPLNSTPPSSGILIIVGRGAERRSLLILEVLLGS